MSSRFQGVVPPDPVSMSSESSSPIDPSDRTAFRYGLNQITDDGVEGWIAAPDPSQRCIVVLQQREGILSRAVACQFRRELLLAGIGDGCYGFKLPIPQRHCYGDHHSLQIVEETTGFTLAISQEILQAIDSKAQTPATDGGNALLARAGFPTPLRREFGAGQIYMGVRPQLRHPAVNCLALVATRNYLPYAKLTAQSFLAYHSDFQVFLLLVDGRPDDAEAFTEGEVVLLRDLGLRHVEWFSARFSAADYSNALKPVFLRYLSGIARNVIYLDCDIAVFSPLTEMLELLETHDWVLLPHMLTPFPHPERFGVHPTRAESFSAGLINAGAFAVKLAHTQKFLELWEEMNFAPGTFREGVEYQTDQNHLNWALILEPRTCVLRDTRYNVAYWNLHERNFRSLGIKDGTPQFSVDGRPLAFFHFSGYEVNDRLRLSRHDGRHSVYTLPAIAEILNWFSDRILGCSAAHLLYEPYRFDTLANGLNLNSFLRRLLKKYEPYIPKFDVQTFEGADALSAFFMNPLPAMGSLLPLIAAEIYDSRPDLQSAFPGAHTALLPDGFLAWFSCHAGQERDVQFLIDRFRRSLTSGSLRQLADQVHVLLGEPPIHYLGADRLAASERLIALGRNDLADALLGARAELMFTSNVSAVLAIYLRRSDLQKKFPDILGQDHERFFRWVAEHALAEHGCPPGIANQFLGRTAANCLPRIFSYLSRHEHLAEESRRCLLSDDPEPLLRHLIRASGEGLEFDLEDVVVLRFIHQHNRHLLVPLYLELPGVRRLPDASRLAGDSFMLLPEQARTAAWARRGCEIHAAYFDRFESVLEQEVQQLNARSSAAVRDVCDYLRIPKGDSDSISSIESAYRAAVRRLSKTGSSQLNAESLLGQRKHCPGVNVFGYFHSDTGVGESSRGLVQTISLLRPTNRIPLCSHQLRWNTKLPSLFQRFDYLTDTNVFVTYPHQRDDIFGLVRSEQLSRRRNVAHLAWEQGDGNPWWKAIYDRFDEIWVISEFAATPFRVMFPRRVRVVPNVLNFENFPDGSEFQKSRLSGDTVNFLFAFDAGSSMERKNPEAVIAAFSRAFKDTVHATRVALTLKANCIHRPEFAQSVERLRHQANSAGVPVYIDERHLNREDTLKLIAAADCYVSLHRSEGFGYTTAEAMFYGIPVIASGYSGNLEYMTPDNSFLVPCTEVYVKNAEGPFQRGSIWGEPDIDIAAAFMRHVVEKPTEALDRATRGRQTVLDKLSATAVSRILAPYFVAAPSSGAGRVPAST